jgi:hypothetical protein
MLTTFQFTKDTTMKLAYRIGVAAALALALCAVVGLSTTTTLAADKVVICHATGSDGNPYVGILVSPGSSGTLLANNGHLDENGSPLSGHEHDIYLGPGFEKADCDKLPPPK